MTTNPTTRLLWSAIEDYPGLWELRWELNGMYDDYGPDGHLAEARRVTKDLLARGWIELMWCVEPYGALTELDPGRDDEEALLDDAARWELPDDGTYGLRVGATEAGERAYEQRADEAVAPSPSE